VIRAQQRLKTNSPLERPPTRRPATFKIGSSLRHHSFSGNPLSASLIANDTL